MIEIEGLRKQYGSALAVDDLSLAVRPGSVFGFIGRNGAGKTTTIRMMMGLLRPSAGTVRLGGHDIAREPEAAKAIIGYVPDRPYLYDKLTAEEFLLFVGGLYGLERTAATGRSTELLCEFALGERHGELAKTQNGEPGQAVLRLASLDGTLQRQHSRRSTAVPVVVR